MLMVTTVLHAPGREEQLVRPTRMVQGVDLGSGVWRTRVSKLAGGFAAAASATGGRPSNVVACIFPRCSCSLMTRVTPSGTRRN